MSETDDGLRKAIEQSNNQNETSENETMNVEISDRDTEEMTLEQLREEYNELNEIVDVWEPYEGQEEAWDRQQEVWRALEKRSDVEIPECPKCDGRRWSQAPGDPVVCHTCGWTATGSMENNVHEAWRRIKEGSDDE